MRQVFGPIVFGFFALAVTSAACSDSGGGGTTSSGGSSSGGANITPDPTGAPGGACLTNDTCQSKLCVDNKCTAPSATDKVKNGTETDVDCGGGSGTPACETGLACNTDTDCKTVTCVQGTCKAPAADDGKRNGTETDTDCGGSNASTPRCRAGKRCAAATDCQSNVCVGKVCQGGTATDEARNDDETDVDCGGARAPACGAGKLCNLAADCQSRICNGTPKKCVQPRPNDGVKNGSETDIDCGGPEAVACEAGKACVVGSDCDSQFCTGSVCEPRKTGRKDGDETDIDCGGRTAPACAADKSCLSNADCASKACSARTKKCHEGPSCLRDIGGETCGTGEFGDAAARHESCCRSLPVSGYADASRPGKTVYLDKYEITAGRMREFLDAIGAANGGQPNVKGYIQANRPMRWKDAWDKALPSGFAAAAESFSIVQPTVDLAYPGQDIYNTLRTQSTWGINSGNYNINPGIYFSLGAGHLFPEYWTGPGWPAPDYAVTHGYNCGNGNSSYGQGTYYFEDNIVRDYSGGVSKYFSQAQLDVKAMNCAPFALYAAFCAWDGGQLATDEVISYVAGAGDTRLRVAGQVPGCANGINSASDGSQRCDNVYAYPPPGNTTLTGASRIAPPGRVAADTVVLNAGDEPWYDLKGNLLEIVVKADNTFNYRGWGIGYGTVTHHRAQILTPRMKGGSFGARCMRFK
jgi:hypothetical protein